MKKLILILSLTSSQICLAKPIYFQTLQVNYPGAPLSFRCQACHQQTSLALNAYGKDFSVLKSTTPDLNIVFRQLDAQDANHNGISNGDEIRADHSPGI